MSSTILDYVMEPSAINSSTTTGGVTVVNHPLVQVHVTKLRNKTTHPSLFRASVRRLAALMAYEATKDLHLDRYRGRNSARRNRWRRAR